MRTIQIIPPGTRTTDWTRAGELQSLLPKSFRKAQDVMLAAKKYRKGSGWFTTDKSRLQRVQAEVYALGALLKQERYAGGIPPKETLVFDFLNEFSQAFPNWQEDYVVLNKLIPRFY